MQQHIQFVTPVPAKKVGADGKIAAQQRMVPAEVPIAISFLGIGYAVMMATPSDLEDFAVGFARSERLIKSAADVTGIEIRAEESGLLLGIELADARHERVLQRVRHRVGKSSCGLCGIENLEQALRPLPKLPAPAADSRPPRSSARSKRSARTSRSTPKPAPSTPPPCAMRRAK